METPAEYEKNRQKKRAAAKKAGKKVDREQKNEGFAADEMQRRIAKYTKRFLRRRD